MPPAARRLPALVAALLLLAGCAHEPTPRERARSFAPHADARIGAEAARDFLIARTGIIIRGVQLRHHRDAAGQIRELRAVSGARNYGLGSATVIDRRGYLLTAAHCVKHDPVYVMLGRGSNLRVEKARVVWRGDFEADGPDVALLRVGLTFDAALEWADHIEPGATVLAAGLDYEQWEEIWPGCIAGVVKKIEARDHAPASWQLIYHEAPLHSGDSGGPLTTRDGRLIGINTSAGAAQFWPFVWRVAIAERLDPAWLRARIEEDYARSSAEH